MGLAMMDSMDSMQRAIANKQRQIQNHGRLVRPISIATNVAIHVCGYRAGHVFGPQLRQTHSRVNICAVMPSASVGMWLARHVPYSTATTSENKATEVISGMSRVLAWCASAIRLRADGLMPAMARTIANISMDFTAPKRLCRRQCLWLWQQEDFGP